MAGTCAKCDRKGLNPKAADDKNKSHKVNEEGFWEKYSSHCSTGKTKPSKRAVLCHDCYNTILAESSLDLDSNDLRVITESSLNTTAGKLHQSTKVNTTTGGMDDSGNGRVPGSSGGLKRSLDKTGSEPVEGQCNPTKKRITDGGPPGDCTSNLGQTTSQINNERSLQIPVENTNQVNCSPPGPSPSAEQQNGERSDKNVPRSYLLQELRRKLDDRSLCNLKFTVKYEEKTKPTTAKSREFFGSTCIMQLWKLRSQGFVFTMISGPEAADALMAYLKFLHTGEIITFECLRNLLANYKLRLVNDFVFGLAFIQSVYTLNEEQISTLQRVLNQTRSSLPMQILTMCTRVGSNRKDTIMAVYYLIAKSKCDWAKGYILDRLGNFTAADKKNFFCWLFCRFSMDPTQSILSVVLEKLEAIHSLEIKEKFVVNHTNANTSAILSEIEVHPVILRIRQDIVNHGEYSKNDVTIRENLRKFSCEPEELKTFINLLYGEQIVENVQTNASVPALIRLCRAFLVKPIPLLYGNVNVDDPKSIRIFMDILAVTGDKEYFNLILSDPYKYLLKENVRSLSTDELRTIIEQDSLAMEEIDLYNLVIEFCSETSDEVEDSRSKKINFSSFNSLAPYIRFGIMSMDEYKTVEDPCYLTVTDMLSVYYIIRNPTGNIKIPETFIKPFTRRRPPSTT